MPDVTTEPEACTEAKLAYYRARQRRRNAIDGLRLLGVAVGATSVAWAAVVAFLTKLVGRGLAKKFVTGFIPVVGWGIAIALTLTDLWALKQLTAAWESYVDAQADVQASIPAVLEHCPPANRPKDLE
jgi:hypothetical protein